MTVRDNTPICVECGRRQTVTDRMPWMQHPVDFGWWCGCCSHCDHPVPDPPERYCPNCKRPPANFAFGRIITGTCGIHGPYVEPTCPGCDHA